MCKSGIFVSLDNVVNSKITAVFFLEYVLLTLDLRLKFTHRLIDLFYFYGERNGQVYPGHFSHPYLNYK